MEAVTAEYIRRLGEDMVTKDPGPGKKLKNLSDVTFKCFYGKIQEEILEIWNMCHRHIPKTTIKHLLWSLMYMKLYNPIDVMAVMADTCKNTFLKWVWKWVDCIAERRDEVIVWNKRYRGAPNDTWCHVSVDGTDFQIGEPTPFDKCWKSPKAKGAAVKYEVAVSIFMGDIVWIYGPHVGSKSDIKIFNEKLRKMLKPQEMVEVDAGYKGNKDFSAAVMIGRLKKRREKSRTYEPDMRR